MTLLRVTGLLVLVLVVWLGMSGQWRSLSSRLPAIARGNAPVVHSQRPPKAVQPSPAAPSSSVPAPMDNTTIVTWRDAQGVVHFASAGLAPSGAQPHLPGTPPTAVPAPARDAR